MKTSVIAEENKRGNKIYGKKLIFILSLVRNLRGAFKTLVHSEEIKGILSLKCCMLPVKKDLHACSMHILCNN